MSTKTTVAGRSAAPSNDSEAPTLSLKACTLAGMASKTTSTIVPKRIAHVPSLQVRDLKSFWSFPVEAGVFNCAAPNFALSEERCFD